MSTGGDRRLRAQPTAEVSPRVRRGRRALPWPHGLWSSAPARQQSYRRSSSGDRGARSQPEPATPSSDGPADDRRTASWPLRASERGSWAACSMAGRPQKGQRPERDSVSGRWPQPQYRSRTLRRQGLDVGLLQARWTRWPAPPLARDRPCHVRFSSGARTASHRHPRGWRSGSLGRALDLDPRPANRPVDHPRPAAPPRPSVIVDGAEHLAEPGVHAGVGGAVGLEGIRIEQVHDSVFHVEGLLRPRLRDAVVRFVRPHVPGVCVSSASAPTSVAGPGCTVIAERPTVTSTDFGGRGGAGPLRLERPVARQ